MHAREVVEVAVSAWHSVDGDADSPTALTVILLVLVGWIKVRRYSARKGLLLI